MSTKKTIAKSFTVSTIEDGVSVQAQYAPNANPTSGQIHTVWQEGDLYMRTRESDESAWSSWHKIVGESGDETDFSFGISQYKTTANASTAPSDISSWSDAPLAVTTAKPYLWAKVQQKSWNASTQAYVVDSTRYIRLTGEDGYTVEAQYAPNNNPTSSQIHTTWQDGDLYMRTKQSNETTWSSWHKIVGESGNDTDYSFAISAYTTPSANGYPSDLGAEDAYWSDAPMAVTEQKPYLWSRVQKRHFENSSPVIDSTSYIRLTGEEGEEGKGYKATVYRNNFTLGEWNTYGTIGHVENWGNTESSRNGCGVGDLFLVVGKATDDSSYHKLTYRCDNSSGNLHGTCVEHQVTNDGKDGTSPYFADLNNEMDAIQCKHDGGVITDQTVSTVISMWKGSAVEAFVIDNIYRNGTQLTWDGNNNGVWPRSSGSTVSLEFTTSASIADIDDFKITIHSYNDNTVTRELHFTINGVRANAIYRLVPSHSQIVKKKDGTYVPSGNVTCSVEKTENGSTSTPSSSEYTLEKSVNGGSYTTYSATAASSITSDLKFRLTVGGVVVDLETIPLVSDGNKGDTGDSAPNAFANPAQISIPCYSNGNVKAQKVTSVIFSLKVGTNTATVTSCADGTKPTGVTVQGQADNAVTITVGTSATASGLSAGVTFTVTGTYDGKTYSANVTVALIGSEQGETGPQSTTPGPRGKIGRFFYYAGAWNDFASTDSFLVNDAQAPYFYYNNNYWVFNPETNGTYTKQNMGTPSSSSSSWEVMTSDFKYIITEAIFGAYAHFGSFIINKDWMISQYGTLVDSSGTETAAEGNPIKLFGNNIHNGTITVRVRFTASGTATLTATASSESYDKGRMKTSGGTTLIEVGGKQSVTRDQHVTSGDYIDLSYSKDRSVSSNDDMITFTVEGVSYTVSLVSATSGMTWTVSSSSGNSAYTYFDPTDPMASTKPSSGYKFRPNFAIDGKTGKTYQNDAYIKGTVYATDGEFTGIIHADSGEFKGDIIVTSGSNTVKINSSGFEGRWGSDGIKLGTSGLQRWHPDTQSWVNMYGNRYVKIVSASSYQISVHDDFIVSTSTNTKLILPAGTDGKVISIKTIGHTVGLYPGKTSSGGNQYIVTDHDITNDHQDINNYDRVELVYYGVRWYWNFMSI